jgi:hypothetical protein
MSKNCVDVTIELSNQYLVPIMLIASRRQIECAELGGGYVENWTTEEFCKYIRDHDKNKKIIIARDHGGPWQHPKEISDTLSLEEAMASAKKSFLVDIESGMDMIHIDPSIDIFESPSIEKVLERVFELYEFCHEASTRLNTPLIYEIGTEEQSSDLHQIKNLEFILDEITKFSKSKNIPMPTFIVSQTGTKVMETQNIGSFEKNVLIGEREEQSIQLSQLIDTCKQYGVWLKEHNADYLSDCNLELHPQIGIHSINVAPEFGVVETKRFLELLLENSMHDLHDQFIELSFNSKKWDKWMFQDSAATKIEKAIISGHYVFATSEFKSIKKQASASLIKKGIRLDDELRAAVKKSILRYLVLLNLVTPEVEINYKEA